MAEGNRSIAFNTGTPQHGFSTARVLHSTDTPQHGYRSISPQIFAFCALAHDDSSTLDA